MTAVLVIIDIISIFSVIFLEHKSPVESLLWILIILSLPYAGFFLYLFFGCKFPIRISAEKRKNRFENQCLKNKFSQITHVDDLELSPVAKDVMNFITKYNNSKITCYDNEEIFTGGEVFFKQLFLDIKEAKTCIYIEFYTIHNDIMGHALIKALTEKAKEGVKVFVLFDFMANALMPAKMVKPLKDAGGKIVRIKPFFSHYRSHKKIVVIDHEISYVGGMNIGEKYADMSKIKKPWRDTQIRLTGHCSAVLDRYFFSDWLCSVKKNCWEETIEYIDSLPYVNHVENTNYCQFVTGGADTDRYPIKMSYLNMIKNAKKRIRIQTPYFIPDSSVLEALKQAAFSGVEIEIMLPGITSNFFLDPVTRYYIGQMLEIGAKVCRYHGYVHAKTIIIDDDVCVIGSVNFDIRSLMINDEICGVFYDKKLIKKYSEIYNEDANRTTPYTLQDFKGRSVGKKIAERIFLIFAPLM